ncbi:MAG: alpha-amylase [Candidatus Aminicenantes bacterium]|nr:alpha-amylase [Candidatus Aminicenantes bacterium]
MEAPVPRSVAAPPREFHVSRACRSRYQFNQALFTLSGNVVLADFQAVRIFAQKIGERRRGDPGEAPIVCAGDLNAMGLIDEILHYVVSLYRSQVDPEAFARLAHELERQLGAVELRKVLVRFCRDFPPQPVYREQVTVEEYLLGSTRGEANRDTMLEEMLLLGLANANPAFSPFRELFDDSGLAAGTAYGRLQQATAGFFSSLPSFGPDDEDLVSMLGSPARACPDSLSGQLRYIREKWGLLLGKFMDRLLTGMDLIREDEKKFFPGPGPAQVFDAARARQEGMEAGEEGERFSADREWMPCLVLMAKSVHVWLDQLGKKYGRPLATLDQVPDEELDQLARRGFSGLWLIGVWERSPASRRIKQRSGNPEAMGSAYSLYRYEIASELGGEAALENLKDRAWARGIRLASDMVPNHMGIDSPWVVEHPDWFIALDRPPFPSYRFEGEDLSSDPRVGIYLEDHYYDRSDAAVVFKWIDRRSGRERFIYHGNDGTRMPWNDTAQLNYLRADVREAVVRTIMDVARMFPIIRFDAAMTLARRHFQRLWFPPPGGGGDIPSRAGQGMSQERFDRLMPWEFWREVVDRVSRERPDTLLLAEAFWLMESYFVRTLGMHRVYNSAFMNFLKTEGNADFRLSLKNALEFNPEILRRFVNFMNNPDEETAVEQFGGGDKYFAACTLLATLPGLPMFGHGQVEGFREKYGMEYRRAYLDERADEGLLRRHERQIFPLLRRRALFAGVDDFLLYDFYLPGGTVDENVIAFSNYLEGEHCLVVVHNRHAGTAGWIRVAAAYAAEDPFGGPRTLVRRDLGQGLALRDESERFVVLSDMVSGLKFVRSSRELCRQGMFVELGAYQVHVFLDIRELADDAEGSLARLAAYLQGRGVSSLDAARREMLAAPLHEALSAMCRPELARRLHGALASDPGGMEENRLWLEIEEKARRVGEAAAAVTAGVEARAVADAIIADLLECRMAAQAFRPAATPGGPCPSAAEGEGRTRRCLLLAVLVRITDEDPERWDDLRLGAAVTAAIRDWGVNEDAIAAEARMQRILCESDGKIRAETEKMRRAGEEGAEAAAKLVAWMLEQSRVQEVIQANSFQGEMYFSKESFALFTERLQESLEWELLKRKGREQDNEKGASEALELLRFLPALAKQSKYKLFELRKLLQDFIEKK